MPNSQKVEKVTALKERIEGSKALLLAGYRGLSVADATELRRSLSEAGARFSVVKNTLMKRAAGAAGLDELEALLEGPTAVAFVSGDPVGAARRVVEAAKRFPTLVLKGGYVEGRVLSAEEALVLASLDSREAMLSKVAGLMKSEMARAASLLQTLQGRFLSLLEAHRNKLHPEEGLAAVGPELTPDLEAGSTGAAEPASAEVALGETQEAETEASDLERGE